MKFDFEPFVPEWNIWDFIPMPGDLFTVRDSDGTARRTIVMDVEVGAQPWEFTLHLLTDPDPL